ncbi:hypothetical protein [Actinoplanes solisilvae]|uniref:hypothetical protein n=1 Tax=Actinoplanes solisilvae TaxID=2486853 RepID=UPI00196BA788|nr:hypothetical protein [Actinoplanes solisilvae]
MTLRTVWPTAFVRAPAEGDAAHAVDYPKAGAARTGPPAAVALTPRADDNVRAATTPAGARRTFMILPSPGCSLG